MRVSINSLQNIYSYMETGDGATSIGAEALTQKIGAQLGGIDEVIDIGSKYQGAIIVKLVTCDAHPDADKLHICKIDDGGKAQDVERDDSGYVQVVCGAPNVHAGMLAVWLPPNSTVPETADKDPFVLGSRELRGVMSNGMLASPKELAFGDSHEGILEALGDYAPGSDFAEATGLKDDYILDIENKMFTHRPDCFGLLGVAREVAGIQGISFKSSDWYSLSPELPVLETEELPLIIKNEIPELVPRFTALTMRGVQVATSPLWLQVELVKSGVRPINNLVDIGNYIMMLTGQPVHIYDYDKVKAHDGGDVATLKIRKPTEGEEVTLLNGKTIKPRAQAILIATESTPIGLGGVMGGSDTEVSNETTNIIIECASFNMYSIRKSSMEHGIFSDAVARFNKGQSPLQTPAVISKLVRALKDISTGKVASAFIDNNNLNSDVIQSGSLYPAITITAEYVNQRLGTDLKIEEMQKLLTNVEFEADIDSEELTLKAPFWRTDIEIKEDIVEEVGRLYGYDQLALDLPRRDITPVAKDPVLVLKEEIRDNLSNRGANEVLTYSFVHSKLIEKVGQDKSLAFELSNALSPDLQYYRLSLLPSLLDKVHANIKAGYSQFALFEMGKTHEIKDLAEDGLPNEKDVLSFVLTFDDKLKKSEPAFYAGKYYLESLASALGVEIDIKTSDCECNLSGMFAKGRTGTVYINGEHVGMIGEFSAIVRKKLKLPQHTVGFEVNLRNLLSSKSQNSKYSVLPKFPGVTQDITLKVPSDMSYSQINLALLQGLTVNLPKHSVHSLEPKGIYQSLENKESVNITWRYSIASHDRTLTDNEVNKILESSVASLEPLGVSRV